MIISETYKNRLQKLAGINLNEEIITPGMLQTVDAIKERLLSSPFNPKHSKLIHEYLKKHPDWFDEDETLALKTVAGDIVIYDGSLYFNNLPITHLGNLEKVYGRLQLENTRIISLGKLVRVGGDLVLLGTPLKTLDNLKYVYGDLLLGKHIKKESLPKILDVRGNIISITGWVIKHSLKENYTQAELLNRKTISNFESLIDKDLVPSEQKLDVDDTQRPEYENIEPMVGNTVDTKPEDLAAKAENLYPGQYKGMYSGENMMESDIISNLDNNAELIIDL